MRRCALIGVLAVVGFSFAQRIEIGGQKAVVLSNGKVELTVALRGATLINLALLDDSSRLNPYWDEAPSVNSRGEAVPPADAIGHFFRLESFGSPSREKPGNHDSVYGESGRQHFEVLMSTKVPPISVIMFGAQLPRAQLLVTRMVQMVDGENVAYIETQAENLLASDRFFSWVEHVTLGPPFLEPGKVLVDLFGCRSNTDRVYGYIAALRRDRHLLFGYVFRCRDFPWLNDLNLSDSKRATRDIEFSTQPIDVSRPERAGSKEESGMPGYRRFAAKSKVVTRFLLFYTKVPDNFDSVADVVLENRQLKILTQAGESVMLNARLPL